MSENPTFGFEPDDDGMINFMTVQLECDVSCFAEYMEVFDALVRLSIDNAGIMPIITFPHREEPS